MTKIKSNILILIICFTIPILLYANEEKPIAGFDFEKNSYQLGEQIKVKETSYSKSGNKITQREWMAVINGKRKTASNLTTLLKGIKPGNIEVFLRVKDEENIWSDWTSRKIEIKPVQTIKITSFKTEKATYALGEKLQFIWDYHNPNELGIKSQRWRYKNITVGGSFIAGKPKYLKKAGTYEVSLEIQDEWGNWSNKASCVVKVTHEQIKRNGEYLFTKGRQGDLLDDYMNKDYNTFEALKSVEITDTPGTLIISNSPESVSSSGILYRDTIEGEGRLLVHHLNNTSVSKKIMIIANTTENRAIHLTIKNEAIQGPDKNILKTGQTAVREYFKGKLEKGYTIKPGELISIYDSSKEKSWENGEVVSGTVDFKSDGPITLTVVSMDVHSSLENISKLDVLEKDVHIRGTFEVIERQYHVDIKDLKNPGKIVIGGEDKEWLVGKDALTGEVVRNRGNYGLSIKIRLKTLEDMGVIVNARGGSYLGAIKWNKEKIFDVPNEEILSNKKLAALIGRTKASTSVEWDYMLPNGSSAPILFGFIPRHLWSE